MEKLEPTRYRILPARPLQVPPRGRVELVAVTRDKPPWATTHAQAIIYDEAGAEKDRVLCRVHDLAAQITVEADAVVWLAVLGNCQLAVRHPGNTEPSRNIVSGFIQQLGAKLVEGNILSQEEWDQSSQYEARFAGQAAAVKS